MVESPCERVIEDMDRGRLLERVANEGIAVL
jgi:hypothetical protein